MEKNCLYCGTHFTTNRKNKKYCSDNCKQMAYFKRNGLVLSGKSETDSVKYNAPAPVLDQSSNTMIQPIVKVEDKKEETVKYVLEEPNVKSVKKQTNTIAGSVSEKIHNEDALQIMLDRFMMSMEQKFNQALENIKQEVKYKSLIVKPDFTEGDSKKQVCNPMVFKGIVNFDSQNKPKISYCNPCENVKYVFDVEEKDVQIEEIKEDSHQIKYIELHGDDEDINENELLELEQNERLVGNNEQEEEEDDEFETGDEPEEKNEPASEALCIRKLEGQLVELKSEAENKKNQLIEKGEPEPEYKWIESSLLREVENNYEKNNTEFLFKNPMKYWSIDETMSMNWINVRLRSIIESMIKLSNYNHIDKNTLLCLTDAINRLVKSNTFKTLPENYPHRELIKEIFIKLNSLMRNTFTEKPKFVLSIELKSRLIAIRHQMIQYTPAIKFSEMDFTEKNYLHPLKNDDLRKKKEWQYRYEAMKREKLRNAA